MIVFKAEGEAIGASTKFMFATPPKNTTLTSVVNCIVIILPVDLHEPGNCMEEPPIVTISREDIVGPSYRRIKSQQSSNC